MSQVIGWQDDGFLVRDGARLVPFADPDWSIGDEVTCIGADGPCPTHARVTTFAQCDACNPLERPECIFEPRCLDGSACSCPFGTRRHAVYLAFFGQLVKVGMTVEDRLATRLREQGADAYLCLATTDDRAQARELERRVSFLYRIPQWRTYKETLPQLARPLDTAAIERKGAAWADRLRSRFPDVTPIAWVQHGLVQPVERVPYRVEAAGLHVGVLIGVKGKYLLYRRASSPLGSAAPPIAALSLGDVVGRTLRTPARGR